MGAIIGLLIALGVGIWVGTDADKRGYSTGVCWAWGIGTFLLLIVVLPIYLITRPKLNASGNQVLASSSPQFCTNCGKYYEGNPKFCPSCGNNVR